MLAHFVPLTYIEAYLANLGAATYLTSVTLFLIGAGGIVGTLLIGRISRKSVLAALVASPSIVAAGFVVLFLGRTHLPVLLTGIALWGIGIAATVVVYQQAILLTGHRAPETATSIGVLLAQAGFAAGSTVGGATIALLGVAAIPLVALAFVTGSIIIATTLRRVIDQAGRRAPTLEVQKAARTGCTADVASATCHGPHDSHQARQALMMRRYAAGVTQVVRWPRPCQPSWELLRPSTTRQTCIHHCSRGQDR